MSKELDGVRVDDTDYKQVVKELAQLIKEHVPLNIVRHRMIGLLTGLSSQIYLLESQIEDLRYEMMDLLEDNNKE